MGGGKSNKSQERLVGMSRELFGETGPLRSLLTSQMEEALSTGGVGARIPIIQKAEERSRLAASKSMRGLEENLARMGLRGTPFGEAAIGRQAQAGEMGVSQIRPSMVSQFLSMIPGYSQGQTGQAIGGMGTAAQTEAQQNAALMRMIAAMFQAGVQAGTKTIPGGG